MASVKTHCYKGTCKTTITGMLTQYKVCTHCKEELSDSLYERIKEKEDDEAKREKDRKDGSEIELPFWEFL